MGTTRVSQHVRASRAAVYRALLDPDAVAGWRVPAGMTSRVHGFDAREGGAFRVSLTYDSEQGVGKSTARTDTYHGHFVRLVPDERTCWWCTRGSRRGCPSPTTRPARGWH